MLEGFDRPLKTRPMTPLEVFNGLTLRGCTGPRKHLFGAVTANLDRSTYDTPLDEYFRIIVDVPWTAADMDRHFGVTVSREELEDVQTLGDLCHLVASIPMATLLTLLRELYKIAADRLPAPEARLNARHWREGWWLIVVYGAILVGAGVPLMLWRPSAAVCPGSLLVLMLTNACWAWWRKDQIRLPGIETFGDLSRALAETDHRCA